jgi:hypothetical protein
VSDFATDNADDEFGLADFNFAQPSRGETAQTTPLDTVHREYLTVKELLKNTRSCKTREKHEAAWNEEIHRPMLVLAFSSRFEDTIAVENM